MKPLRAVEVATKMKPVTPIKIKVADPKKPMMVVSSFKQLYFINHRKRWMKKKEFSLNFLFFLLFMHRMEIVKEKPETQT